MHRRFLTLGAYALAFLLLASAPAVAVVADPSRDVPHLPRSCLGPGDVIPSDPGACHLTPFRKGRPTLVLWGDSHAWQFIPALRSVLGRRDVNLVAFVMGICPPFQAAPLSSGRRGTKCVQSNRKALNYVRTLDRGARPLRVLVGADWESYRRALQRAQVDGQVPSPGYQTQLLEMAQLSDDRTPMLFRTLGKARVDVDVIAQTARVPRGAAPCAAGSKPYACDMLRATAIPNEVENRRWLQRIMEPLSGKPRYIDINQHICDDRVCHGRIGRVYTFYDDLHLSATRTRNLRSFFVSTFRGLW